VSRSELEGLRWEDRRVGYLHITRSCVEGDLKETKTQHRKAAVPIIPYLEKVLETYHYSMGSPKKGWMFPSDNPGRPMRMNNLYRRHIEDILDKKGITWHGWHAFRRGLATNLSELGVPDDVIQKILRHGDIEVTQKNYRKTRNPKVDAAMKKLSAALRKNKV
jgi:integrase